jgi:hypothetical protein
MSTMLSSFTKSIRGNKTSSNSYSKPVSPSVSIHDSSARPVHTIQEHETVREENPQDLAEKKTPSIPFDEVSLSTHGSLCQVPVQTVFICDEEGNVLPGNDSFGDEASIQEMDQDQERPAENQGESPSKDRDGGDHLSFHADGSDFDGSDLERVLAKFNVEEESRSSPQQSGTIADAVDVKGTPSKTDTIHALVPETERSLSNEKEDEEEQDVEDFNEQAFTDFGKMMFKQQPDTLGSKGSSIRSNPTVVYDTTEVKKILFEKNNRRIIVISRITMYFKACFAFFAVYGITCFWYKHFALPEEVEEELIAPLCIEESFHHAMYHLSSATNPDPLTDHSDRQDWYWHPYWISALTIVLYQCFIVQLFEKAGVKLEVKKATAGQARFRNKVATPKSAPKLKREMNSLDKKKIFASTFVAEVVSPAGSINAVKRSSRVKISGQAIGTSEVVGAKVDLFASFDAEPRKESDNIKSKVKSEQL